MWPFKKKEIVTKEAMGGTWTTSAYSPNWFQKGDTVGRGTALQSTAVFTCVSKLANGISRLRLKHYMDMELKGRTYLYNSELSKLINKPNNYQNRMDFILYLMMSLLLDGNAYALAKRDNTGKVIALYPISARSIQVHVVPETNEVWYSINQTDDLIPDFDSFVPASEIVHFRLFTPVHPLIGVSPLVASSLSVEAGRNIQDQSNNFFANKSKIGGYLRTPNKMDPTQAKALGKAWNEGTNGNAAGKTALLDNDLSFESFTLNAVDAEVINQYKLSVSDIASVYHIPFHMVDPKAPHNYESAEAVSRAFASSSLSFYVEYLETGFNNFFNLDGVTDYLEFDVEEGIGRGDLKSRMDAYSTAIHGAILTPNDARALENLEPKNGGDEVFLQLQDRPLSEISDEFRLKNEKVEAEINKLEAEADSINNPSEPGLDPEPVEDDNDDDADIQLMLDMEFPLLEKVS